MVWVHWVVSTYHPIPGACPRTQARQGCRKAPYLGSTILKRWGYGAAVLRLTGRHRYFHKLYALDNTLDLRGATKSQIERAMQGHVLANAELIGTYQRGDR